MAIRMRCPNPSCGQILMIPEQYAGQGGACKYCKTSFAVPANASTSPGVGQGVTARSPAPQTVSTKLNLLAKVRLAGDPEAKWTELCTTRGPVEVSARRELSLQPMRRDGFGDAELGRLAVDFACTNVTHLDLSYTHVTDAELARLAGLTSLEDLDLCDCTDVTDAGLAHIAWLKSLRKLDQSGTRATRAGVAALKEKLPGCEVC